MTEYVIKNIIFFAITIVACLIFRLMLGKSKFKKNSANNVLRYPILYRLAPLSFVCYCAVIAALVFTVAKGDWIYLIVAIVVALGGIVLMVCWSLWRVDIYDEKFVYRNFWGKKSTYGYENLELRVNANKTKWFFFKDGVQVFCMRYYIQNGEKLRNAYEKFLDK